MAVESLLERLENVAMRLLDKAIERPVRTLIKVALALWVVGAIRRWLR